MSRQSVSLKIHPGVLKWALDSTGWDADELAKKTKIKTSSIVEWQKHESEIPLPELKKISASIKVPLDVLFLPAPPDESHLPYYRTAGSPTDKKLSKKTYLTIRRARHTQFVAAELLKMRKQPPKPKIDSVTLGYDPAEVADTIRRTLELGQDFRQDAIRSPSAAYKQLRTKIESKNIFVLQFNMPIDEARGLSLTNNPQVILVNSAIRCYRTRIFILLHEFAHVLLNKDGICLVDCAADNVKLNNLPPIETWCNMFAESLLMPENEFLEELIRCEKMNKRSHEVVAELSKIFGVNEQAACVRILRLSNNNNLRKKRYSDYYRNSLQTSDIKKRISNVTITKNKFIKELARCEIISKNPHDVVVQLSKTFGIPKKKVCKQIQRYLDNQPSKKFYRDYIDKTMQSTTTKKLATVGPVLMNTFKKEFIRCKNTGAKPRDILVELSKTFGMREEIVCMRILRLLRNPSLSRPYFDYYETLKAEGDKKHRSGNSNQAIRCLNSKGGKLVNLIVDSYNHNLITYHEKCKYLDINSRYLDYLEARI